jgi:hypothetical protein
MRSVTYIYHDYLDAYIHTRHPYHYRELKEWWEARELALRPFFVGVDGKNPQDAIMQLSEIEQAAPGERGRPHFAAASIFDSCARQINAMDSPWSGLLEGSPRTAQAMWDKHGGIIQGLQQLQAERLRALMGDILECMNPKLKKTMVTTEQLVAAGYDNAPMPDEDNF